VTFRARFIGDEGREPLVAELVRLFSAVRDSGQPILTELVGSSGVGKTRVVQEFYERLAGDQSYWPTSLIPADFAVGLGARKRIAVLDNTFVAPSGKPDWLWLGIECELTSRRSYSSDVSKLRGQLEAALDRLVGVGILAALRRSVSPSRGELFQEGLGQFGPVTLATSAAQRLATDVTAGMRGRRPGEVDWEELEALAIVAGLRELSSRRDDLPVVLVVEDAHYAFPAHSYDHSTLKTVLDHLLRAPKPPPVLIVLTYWPEHSPRVDEWVALTGLPKAQHHRHELKPFGVAGLLTQVVLQAAPATDKRLADRLARHVEGNPLVLEEILEKELSPFTGHVTGTGKDRAIDVSLDVEALPRSLPGIVEELWESVLTEEARFVLGVAATLGRRFDADLAIGVACALVSELNEREGNKALSQAANPHRWISVLEESLRYFDDADRWDTARVSLDTARRRQTIVSASNAIAELRDRSDWTDRSAEVRLVLLETHLALACEALAESSCDLDPVEVDTSAYALLAGEHGVVGPAQSSGVGTEPAEDPVEYLRLAESYARFAQGNGEPDRVVAAALYVLREDPQRAWRLVTSSLKAEQRPVDERYVLGPAEIALAVGKPRVASKYLWPLRNDVGLSLRTRLRAMRMFAQARVELGRIDEAIRLLRRANDGLSKEPAERRRNHLLIARSLDAAERTEDAIQEWRRLVQLGGPTDAEAGVGLAAAYQRAGQEDEAVTALVALDDTQIPPDERGQVAVLLIEALSRAGRADAARDVWHEATSGAMPERLHELWEAARPALLYLGRVHEAVGLFRHRLLNADDAATDHYWLRRGLAETLIAEHQIDDGIRVLEEMLATDAMTGSRNWTTRFTLALALAQNGEDASAHNVASGLKDELTPRAKAEHTPRWESEIWASLRGDEIRRMFIALGEPDEALAWRRSAGDAPKSPSLVRRSTPAASGPIQDPPDARWEQAVFHLLVGNDEAIPEWLGLLRNEALAPEERWWAWRGFVATRGGPRGGIRPFVLEQNWPEPAGQAIRSSVGRAWRGLGLALVDQSLVDTQVDTWRTLLSETKTQSPEHRAAQRGLAEALSLASRSDDAVTLLTRFVRMQPPPAELAIARRELAGMLVRVGQVEEAVDFYFGGQGVIGPPARRLLAQALAEIGLGDEAYKLVSPYEWFLYLYHGRSSRE
jgi:tetratricopeptide (TPR) repeat protein